jgi:hypothetical protein
MRRPRWPLGSHAFEGGLGRAYMSEEEDPGPRVPTDDFCLSSSWYQAEGRKGGRSLTALLQGWPCSWQYIWHRAPIG